MIRRLTAAEEARLRLIYKKWHWGEPATHLVETDPDLPHLVQIGNLMEMHVQTLPGRKPQTIAVEDSDVQNNHVGFDPSHRYQRIYLQLSPSSKRSARVLWDVNDASYTLSQLAKMTGGRHSGVGYPGIRVQPLGRLVNLVYYTHKRGDGPSGYIHEMGEEGGIPPLLCVANDGRLWLAGGSYTCPNPGITN